MAIPQVQPVLNLMTMGRNRFLYGLDKTPDDRLSWSPGGEAWTPLQLAGRLSAFLRYFAAILETRTMPDRSGGPPPPPQSRESARAAVEAGFAELRRVVEQLTEADLQQPVPTPWRSTVPTAEMLWVIPSLTGYFQGQLNHLQLAYGDKDPNIPPDWGRGEG